MKNKTENIQQINEIYVRKFIKEHYMPVEDKPGYVWFSKKNMQIVSVDLLVAAYMEVGDFEYFKIAGDAFAENANQK